MKKNFLLVLLITITSVAARSQFKPGFNKTKGDIQTKTTTTPATTPAPVYTLTGVRVSIRTGSDNKEFPSGYYAYLRIKDRPGSWIDNLCYYIKDLRNEMAVNTTIEVGMQKETGNADKFLLSTIQNNGLELTIQYFPNFFMDAWKIENISCILEFRDQNGNLHPTLGAKTISFTNAVGFLNNEYRNFKCTIDQNLSPLMASITK